jgi:GNAT superfamily N-acetyltransferase
MIHIKKESETVMLIRPACVDDAAAIALVAAGLGYKEEAAKHSAVQRLERLLGSNDDRAWVAELDGVVIGWLHAQHAFRMASADFIEILGLSVSAEARFKGAGRVLVEQARRWASEEHVMLRVRTNDNREEAKKFYLALDFLLVKRQSIFELSL